MKGKYHLMVQLFEKEIEDKNSVYLHYLKFFEPILFSTKKILVKCNSCAGTITVAIHGAEQTGRPIGSAAWGACV